MKVITQKLWLIAVIGIVCPAMVLAQGELATWNMDSITDVGGANYILDGSGNGNDLRLGDDLAIPEYDASTQPALVGGSTGNALEFDGVNDKAIIIGGWQGWNSVKIEVSIKPGRVTGDDQWIVEANDAWSLRQVGNKVYLYILNAVGNVSNALVSDVEMQAGSWYKIVAESDPEGEMTLTVNGYTARRAGAYVSSVVRNISVGANFNSTATRFFQGVIDDVQISSSAIADAPKAAVNDLSTIGLWHMEAIVANQIIDDCNDVDPTRLNNLTIQPNGAAIDTGIVGNAISFDGGTQFTLDTNGWKNTYEDFEVDFWMYPTSTAVTTTPIFMGGTQVEFRQTNAIMTVYVYNSAAAAQNVSLVDCLTSNQWHHIIAKFSSRGELVLTVNGKSIGKVIANPPIRLNSGTIAVGAHSNGARPFFGLIDEVKINAPRQVATLSGDWQSPYEDSYNTLGLWHFDGMINVADEKYIDDDDAGNADRDQILRLQQVSAGVAFTATDGPQITNASDYPADNPAFGTCIYLDGVDDNLRTVGADIPVNVNPTDLRVEAWVKPDPSFVSGTYGYVYHRRGAVRLGLYLRAGGDMELYHWVVANNADYSSTSTPLSTYCNPYEWNHIALVVNGGLVRKYVNGELIYSDYLTQATLKPNTNTWTGFGSYTATSHWFHGWIDEIRVSTAVHEIAPCGFWGYYAGDINQDCYVDLLDYAQIAREWIGTTDELLDTAENWTLCSDPSSEDCSNIQF